MGGKKEEEEERREIMGKRGTVVRLELLVLLRLLGWHLEVAEVESKSGWRWMMENWAIGLLEKRDTEVL